MKEELNGFREQHEMSYRNAILDTIKNNTEVLVNQDIVSLFQKPPLDSMDLLRTKFLNLAKKNKIVLNTEGLGYLLSQYRSYLLDCCDEIKSIRIDTLSKVIKKEGNGVIQINKKDFVTLNKKMKKVIKEKIVEGTQVCIMDHIDMIFNESVDSSIKSHMIDDISKYLKGMYQRQLLENIDIKVLVKDTTLMNSTKEQGERYLFALDHSKLLNENDS